MNDDLTRLVGCLVWLMIPVVLIAFIVYGIIAGFKSLKNLIEYGRFTSDTRTAMVEDHFSDARYFAELAGKAGVSLVSSSITTVDGSTQLGSQGITASFTFKNSSNRPHNIQISLAKAVAIINGSHQVVSLDCNIGPGNNFTVPAGATTQTGQCFANSLDSVAGQAKLVQQPEVIAIDNLPVTGGPSNTPWQCEVDEGPNDFEFSNNC